MTLRIITDLAQSAVLTRAGAVTGAGAATILGAPGDVWYADRSRYWTGTLSASTGAISHTLTYLTDQTISGIAIAPRVGGPEIAVSSSGVRIDLKSSAGTVLHTATKTLAAGAGAIYHAPSVPVEQVRSVVVTHLYPGSGSHALSIGRIIAGSLATYTTQPEYGAEIGFASESAHKRLASGGIYTVAAPVWRRLVLPLSWIGDTDRAALTALLRDVGPARDLYVEALADVGSAALQQDYRMICRVEADSRMAFANYAGHTSSITFQEA